MATILFSQVLTDALTELNALTPGQPPDAADLTLAFNRGNAFLDSMNARSLMQFVTRLDSYPFATSKQVYTIGRGTAPAADFVADRPVEILAAAIVDTTQSPEVFIPVSVVDADVWESFSVIGYDTSVPTQLWYEPTFPNGRIHMRGIPSNVGYELRIQTTQSLGQAAALTTVFSFPPGYYEAFLYSLAERLCNPFGKVGEIAARLRVQAREARAIVSSVNAESPLMLLDGLKTGKEQPYYNWLLSPYIPSA